MKTKTTAAWEQVEELLTWTPSDFADQMRKAVLAYANVRYYVGYDQGYDDGLDEGDEL